MVVDMRGGICDRQDISGGASHRALASLDNRTQVKFFQLY